MFKVNMLRQMWLVQPKARNQLFDAVKSSLHNENHNNSTTENPVFRSKDRCSSTVIGIVFGAETLHVGFCCGLVSAACYLEVFPVLFTDFCALYSEGANVFEGYVDAFGV